MVPLNQNKNFQAIHQQVFIECPEFPYKYKKEKSIMSPRPVLCQYEEKRSEDICFCYMIFIQKVAISFQRSIPLKNLPE